MPRKVFVAGEILTAADVNTNLADQAVMTFAGTAARGSAIGTAVEGMVTYLEDTDQLEVYGGTAVGWSSASNFLFGTATPTEGQVATFSTAVSGYVPADAPSGKVLQVVSTTKTDTFSTTSTSFTDVTGLSVSITPTSASSKILVIVGTNISGLNDARLSTKLVRNSTDIFLGDAAGSRTRASSLNYSSSSGGQSNYFGAESVSYTVLDSPSTTSSTTYKVQARTETSALYVNRSAQDADNSGFGRGASSITVMEIAG